MNSLKIRRSYAKIKKVIISIISINHYFDRLCASCSTCTGSTVIPFFGYIYNENAGEEGFPQLFKGTHDAPEAVYESSLDVLNALFPKGKTLMLMCQSGGRVAMLMKMLAANGYDMSKIYNVGGMAQYAGEQYRDYITDTEELNIEVKYLINAN
jgi:rhodanese-related sulfurtransferase